MDAAAPYRRYANHGSTSTLGATDGGAYRPATDGTGVRRGARGTSRPRAVGATSVAQRGDLDGRSRAPLRREFRTSIRSRTNPVYT
jgi:hypothetical protein